MHSQQAHSLRSGGGDADDGSTPKAARAAAPSPADSKAAPAAPAAKAPTTGIPKASAAKAAPK